jgi:pimeloyl-ACP methyl ester carboxylesterase
MGGDAKITDADVEGYAAPYRDTAALRAFFATARAIVSETDRAAVAKRYKAIDVPVLAIWCRKDPIVPLKAGRKLVAAIPRAKLAIMEECHHLPQHERPEDLIRLINKFADAPPRR